MQCGGGYFIAQHKSLCFIAYAYRNRTAGVIAVCFGGHHPGQFRRQRMLVLAFDFIAQLRGGRAAPPPRTGTPAKLFHLSWRTADAEDEPVGSVANIVINNLPRIDIASV